MKHLYIVRGLPGSGKTTIAKQLTSNVFEADQYFEQSGEYNFVASEIAKAHKWCQRQVETTMKDDVTQIAVSNTFTQKWEVEPYIKLARQYDYTIQIITVQGEFQNVHGVPESSIKKMKNRWQHFTFEDFDV